MDFLNVGILRIRYFVPFPWLEKAKLNMDVRLEYSFLESVLIHYLNDEVVSTVDC